MAESKVSEVISPEFFIRKADLDDVETINTLIVEDVQQNINTLYDFPNVLNLFEKYFCHNVKVIYIVNHSQCKSINNWSGVFQ
jgi:hypothetical protein